MAKKLENHYSIDVENDIIKIKDNIRLERLLLITDVDRNRILYNFGVSGSGVVSRTFDEATEMTSFQLEKDLSVLQITSQSKLQIFVEKDYTAVEFDETYIDPVSKLRVGNPQNLIDTDFEYGLQNSKWETLELSNNVPSYYISDADYGVSNLISVSSRANSDIITVVTGDPHRLAIGTPIDVRGLSSNTAEGKYLITSIADDYTFSYKARQIQGTTGQINGTYTIITPGQFYAGSEIPYLAEGGIISDEAQQSTVTVLTPTEHGFISQSNFYIVNTTAPKVIEINQTNQTAPDGYPYVDPDNTVTDVLYTSGSRTETKQMKSTYSFKIDENNVDVAGDRILWQNSGLHNYDTILYSPANGDKPIGGLNRFDTYFVRNIDASGFQLSDTYNGTVKTFTSAGTYNNGKAGVHLCYSLYYINKPYRAWYARYYTHAYGYGDSYSGWDLRSASGYFNEGYYGIGQKRPEKIQFFSPSGYDYTTLVMPNPYFTSGRYSGMSMPEGSHASYFNFLEDYSMYNNYRLSNPAYYTFYNSGYVQMYDTGTFYYYYGTYNYSWGLDNRVCMIYLETDEEADTLYVEDHNLLNGSQVTLETTGSQLYYNRNNTSINSYSPSASLADGTYTVEVVTQDRFRLRDSSGNRLRLQSAEGNYTFTANVVKESANSFYSADHGLSNDETIIFNLDGGSTPNTDTGALVFNSDITTGNIQVAHNTLTAGLEEWLGTNIAGHRDIYLDGYDARYPILNGDDGSRSTWLRQYYYNGVYTYDRDNGVDANTANSATTYEWGDQPVDLATGTVNANKGFTAVGTKFESGTEVPHFSVTYGQSGNGQNMNSDYRLYTYTYYDVSSYGDYKQKWEYRSHGNNYYSTGTYQIEEYNGRDGHCSFEMVFWNENWFQGNTDYWYSYNNYYPFPNYRYTYSNRGYNYIKFNSIFMFTDQSGAFVGGDGIGTEGHQYSQATGNSTAFFNMIDYIITYFQANFIKPTLTNGGTYKTKVLNNDRFSLVDATSGVELDLTSYGTPSFNFELPSNGASDGAYTVSAIPQEDAMEIKLPFAIKQRTLSFDGQTDVTGSTALVRLQDHKLISGLPLTYDPDGNVDLTGLTSGSTYYANVRDEHLIGLSTSQSIAIAGGELVAIESGSVGTHKFYLNALNGQFPGEGFVSLQSGSVSVVGSDDTLFKRYFKPGDIFVVKDTSTSPGSLAKFTIGSIADDNNLTLTSVSTFDATNTKYFIQTLIYARPDGTFLHRPFDGGVEITAGTAPFSQITRQTRKYFRYQSGKGIQTSLAINFNPPVLVEQISAQGDGDSQVARITTKYPHTLSTENFVKVEGASDPAYNKSEQVSEIIDPFTFTYSLSGSNIQTTAPGGLVQFNVDQWSDSRVRAGMFDFQNGFFYEFDGSRLWAVRRSSTQQISGTATVVKGSNQVFGIGTNFSGQLNKDDYVVIRGASYKVVKVKSRTEMVIQPQYKGASASGVVLTLTQDVRVPQEDWNLDPADGNGPSGFNLDTTKIQMAYMDYSWYGAGKVRFGFKDRLGKVIYVHHFLHNNRLTEAYMRSGNLPAKYEIFNEEAPTYVPSLFHWGTSVIMDGRFDEDDSYLFTAASNALTFTNGQSNTATTNATSTVTYSYNRSRRTYDWYVRLSFPSADASKFAAGTKLYATGTTLQGQEVTYTQYSGSNILVYIYFGSGWSQPAGAFNIPSATAVNIGAPATGDTSIDLGVTQIPLITIRLSPSVDSGLPGALGEREIINRMQLKLSEVGMIITHDCEVSLLLNADLSNISYEAVTPPSLSQLIKHQAGDQALGGTQIFQYRASGGTSTAAGKRLTNTSNQHLGDIIDLGNSILGGDGTFPNGPDTLTVAVDVVDTTDINADSPFQVSSRITWAESQA